MIPTDTKRKNAANVTVSSSIPASSSLYWDIVAFQVGAEPFQETIKRNDVQHDPVRPEPDETKRHCKR